MRCETCGSFEAEHAMPLIGDLCFTCYTILEKPFMCEGLIPSAPIKTIAIEMDNEFLRRVTALRDKAQQVIRGHHAG
jgi:hypothetical protein